MLLCENCAEAHDGMPYVCSDVCILTSKCSNGDRDYITECKGFKPKPMLTLNDAKNITATRLYAGDKEIVEYNEKPPEKPPLGVTPVYIVAYRRMEELCDAIKNELHYDNTDLNTIIRWAKEIQLQSNLVIEMGKKADKNE